MFGTIRRHQKWLWAVIITLTIISFVIFFSPYSKLNNERQAANYGSIDGQKIGEDQFIRARREVDLHYFFMSGQWPEEGKNSRFDPLRETYQWLVLVSKEDQLGIRISDNVAERMAWQLTRRFERNNINSPKDFIQKVLGPRGWSVGDFERFIRHYVGLQELIATVGLSGDLMTPQEARSLYDREHQELATAAVFFSATNYLANVTITSDALAQFYSNRLANYRVPERVQVSYVRFNITNYLPQAETELKTNLNQMVEDTYRQYGTNLFPEAKSPDEAKAKLRDQLIRRQALMAAKKKALAFANILVEMEPKRTDNLQDLARTNGLTVSQTAPFDREDGPKDLEGGPDFVRRAFELTPQEPFAGPVVAPDGVYELALNRRLAAEDPPLDQLRERVTADFKHSQAALLARQAGAAFSQTLNAGLAQGKSFADICTEAKVKPVELPPLSLSTRGMPEVEDQASLDQVKQLAFGTQPGKASNLQPTTEGGMLVYVKAKLPLDTAKVQSDLPGFTTFVRKRRQEEAFNQWFSKEFSKQLREGLRGTPLAQPQQAQPAVMNTRKAKS